MRSIGLYPQRGIIHACLNLPLTVHFNFKMMIPLKTILTFSFLLSLFVGINNIYANPGDEPSSKIGMVAFTVKANQAYEFSEGLALIKIDNKAGFIDARGVMVIKPTFDNAESFSQHLAVAKLGGKYGYIDKTGNWAIPPRYDHAESFKEGMACVLIGESRGFINKQGKLLFSNPMIAGLFAFSEGMLRIRQGWETPLTAKNGFLNHQGNVQIHPIYDHVEAFSEGLASVRLGSNPDNALDLGKSGYIDKHGKMLIEPQYEEAGSFREGLAYVRINKKFGYIDKKGKMIIPAQFDSAYSFSEGFAAVAIGNTYGFINHQGTLVIKPQFSWVLPFKQGLAGIEASSNQGFGFIDRKGNIVVKPAFSEIGNYSHDLAPARTGNAEWSYLFR